MKFRKNFFSFDRGFSTAVALPVTFLIILAIYFAYASVNENIRFSRATEQLLNVIAVARSYASKESSFATQPNENVLRALVRTGQLHGAAASGDDTQLTNPWDGAVTLSTPFYSVVRLETAVPTRDCRRLALFFIQDAGGLGFEAMEAREGSRGAWRRFYDRSQARMFNARAVEAACGQSPDDLLALVFRVR